MASVRKRPRKDGTYTYAILYNIDGRQSSLPFKDEKPAKAFAALIDSVVPRALSRSTTSTRRPGGPLTAGRA